MAHKAKKSLGQNFLINKFVIQNIVKEIDPQEKEIIIEIGSGHGALTTNLLEYDILLHIIELDNYLVEKLKRVTINNNRIIIHHKDVLDFDFNLICGVKKIVGNLPYNISSSILANLTNYVDTISSMCFMVQKELALRITANPNQKNYGRLSVFLQYFFDIEYLFDINPECFIPQPKVVSTLIRLVPRNNNINILNLEDFVNILRYSFHMKRKTIHNNLKNIIDDKVLIELEINPNDRPENISLCKYIKLSNYWTLYKKSV